MLAFIELSGSAYALGKKLGQFGAQAAHQHLVKSASWQTIMAWRGSPAMMVMRELVHRHFPHIEQEIKGLAEGLQLDSDDVFLWNCRGDLWAMAPDGCTTVQLPSDRGPRITHNEDGDPGFAGHCAIARFTPDEGGGFTSFIYPASLPGHTFAVTAAGLAMTVNNLRMRGVAAGIPRMVLTRALLDQGTLEDAVTLLERMPRSGGFHLSLAQRARAELMSIEFSSASVSVQSAGLPLLHANHAIHPTMAALPQIITASSLKRQERGDALLSAGHPIDPLAILADQAHPDLPIYRDAPDDSDNENTMATADIHIGADHIRWQVYAQAGQLPAYHFTDIDRT